jgi:microcystin-dependent protein
MLAIVVIENGQKKYIPLTADAGAGNPVGSLLHTYKKSNPSGYLYCDGSTFDQTKYPLLYAYLGSNVLPDYRECVEVGAEQNTTDTIATHDVYTQGQFKDDQLQSHGHSINYNPSTSDNIAGSTTKGYSGTKIGTDDPITGNARTGTTTHGKQKAVFVYIKATSGLSENAQDNVINTLNEQRSYSTTEHWTGKYWKDGKKIYSKTIDCGALLNATTKTITHSISNLGRFTKVEAISTTANNNTLMLPYVSPSSLTAQVGFTVDATNIEIRSASDYSLYEFTDVTLEYTKTTD